MRELAGSTRNMERKPQASRIELGMPENRNFCTKNLSILTHQRFAGVCRIYSKFLSCCLKLSKAVCSQPSYILLPKLLTDPTPFGLSSSCASASTADLRWHTPPSDSCLLLIFPDAFQLQSTRKSSLTNLLGENVSLF